MNNKRKERIIQHRSKLIYGIGLNDAQYKVIAYRNGKVIKCPVYSTWVTILRKCSPDDYYGAGCTICSEWRIFSNFREWFIKEFDSASARYKLEHTEKLMVVSDISNHYSPSTAFVTSSSIVGMIKKSKVIYKNGGCIVRSRTKKKHYVMFSDFRHGVTDSTRCAGRYKGSFSSVEDAEKHKILMYNEQVDLVLDYLKASAEKPEVIQMIKNRLVH